VKWRDAIVVATEYPLLCASDVPAPRSLGESTRNLAFRRGPTLVRFTISAEESHFFFPRRFLLRNITKFEISKVSGGNNMCLVFRDLLRILLE